MPVEFVSVLSPASFHNQSMSIIYWALTGAEGYYKINSDRSWETFDFNFKPYLLSMSSRYALLLPTNDAMQTYIDPASYGGEQMRISEDGDTVTLKKVNAISWEYDTSQDQNMWVQAKPRPVVVEKDGSLTLANTANQQPIRDSKKVNNMLENLINQLIIVIPDSMKQKTLDDYLNEGYPYFLTKGGSMVRVSRGENGNLAFEGGWQMEGNGKPVEVSEEYNEDNGVSYQLENNLPLPTTKSLSMVLKSHDEYRNFMYLANNDVADLFSDRIKGDGTYTAGSSNQNNVNLTIFDNYNYTVYVPSNNSIEQLQTEGKLPSFETINATWNTTKTAEFDSLLEAEHLMIENFGELSAPQQTNYRKMAKQLVQDLLRDFVRYHVQDHSVAVGLASDRNNGQFETMKRNPVNNRFFTLSVNFDNQQITVTDELGQRHHVITTPGLYNNIVREYWFSGGLQRMVSDAVVHLIDSPLMYQTMRPWREVVLEVLEAEYKK